MQKPYTHMTFFWGKNSEILFRGWPGTRGGMYALALVVAFLMALLVELLSCRHVTGLGRRRRSLLGGLFQTAVCAVRVGIAYLLMLALMSCNVGVLLVAVAGSAVGFLLFHSSVFCPAELTAAGGAVDASAMKC